MTLTVNLRHSAGSWDSNLSVIRLTLLYSTLKAPIISRINIMFDLGRSEASDGEHNLIRKVFTEFKGQECPRAVFS